MIPDHGSTIVFDTIPAGSYASAGVAYSVRVSGKGARRSVSLTNVATGSGTTDAAAMDRRATWRRAA